MPPAAEGDETTRLSVGGESRIVDVTSSGAAAVTSDADEVQPLGEDATRMGADTPAPGRATEAMGAGATTVLVRNAIPAGSGPAPVDAGVIYVGSRRTERLIMALSTVLGTVGLLLAVAAAGLDQVRYNLPAACAAYQTNHSGALAFGCTVTAKRVAVLLPVLGIPLLVLLGLIAVWVPGWRPKARLGLLAGLFVVLVLCAVIVALAYTALPKN